MIIKSITPSDLRQMHDQEALILQRIFPNPMTQPNPGHWVFRVYGIG